MNRDLAQMRRDYHLTPLLEEQAGQTPWPLFEIWMQEAIQSPHQDANAMLLSSVDTQGQPHARIVLLKGYSTEGLVFYTNYQSAKGQEIAQSPKVALTFWWEALERQIRIEGEARQLAPEASDTYFQSRPRDSQLGAWASAQSQILQSREQLSERFQQLQDQYPENAPIPRPAHWGGYCVHPHTFEFWQGQPNRLHDRLRFERHPASDWQLVRLSP
ncbi:pyridoxamine 5'-phosphate oxidase [Allopseudospirillum japonicum]|uniref:Pyridoxine/pyridoxamine 5'-phosphate oxidase n=1 Tax=Allopseudospirillum japonicum TaxID=64971 RepID=A0A1H6T805_9GAMM|nr:pyridoxamine 5'-phosphate oxidase [Allopseudospirillum japonicum]SEI76199.1 pyridoxamine 5'-phosphate oxidase [Allopseudospirillum japonicum]